MKDKSNMSDRYRRGIRAALTVRKMSGRQASLKAGFNENQITRFLTGSTDIKVSTLDKLCDAIGVSPDTVWELGK